MQELADSRQAATHTDQDTGGGKDRSHGPPDRRKVDDREKLQPVGHRKALCDRFIQEPLQAKAKHRAEKADHKALVHERPADEAVRRADHFHNGDLVAAVKRRELDGVGDDEDRNEQQNRDERDAHHARDISQRDEAARDILVHADVGDALNIVEDVLRGLAGNAQIVNIDSVAVAQNLGVKVLEHVVPLVTRLKGLHRLFLADEDAFLHVGALLNGAAHGLGLRIVAALVHEGENFILALELLELHLRIVRHERKCTHDDKAGDRDAHGRKGHESVREHVAHALAEKVRKIVFAHSLPRIIADAVAIARDDALFERDDAFFELIDKIFLVRDDDHRRAEMVDALEQAHDLQRARGVQVARRLVGDDGAGVVDERTRNGHALLFAAGELVGITVGLFLKSDELKHIGDALFDLARRRTDGAHGEAQVLVDRFLLDQAEVLEDDADGAAQQRDLPLGNVRQAEAVDGDLAGRRYDLAGEQLDNRRLAAAARADQKDELPILDAKRNAL